MVKVVFTRTFTKGIQRIKVYGGWVPIEGECPVCGGPLAETHTGRIMCDGACEELAIRQRRERQERLG